MAEFLYHLISSCFCRTYKTLPTEESSDIELEEALDVIGAVMPKMINLEEVKNCVQFKEKLEVMQKLSRTVLECNSKIHSALQASTNNPELRQMVQVEMQKLELIKNTCVKMLLRLHFQIPQMNSGNESNIDALCNTMAKDKMQLNEIHILSHILNNDAQDLLVELVKSKELDITETNTDDATSIVTSPPLLPLIHPKHSLQRDTAAEFDSIDFSKKPTKLYRSIRKPSSGAHSCRSKAISSS